MRSEQISAMVDVSSGLGQRIQPATCELHGQFDQRVTIILGGKTYNVKASRSTAEDLRIEALKFGRTHRK